MDGFIKRFDRIVRILLDGLSSVGGMQDLPEQLSARPGVHGKSENVTDRSSNVQRQTERIQAGPMKADKAKWAVI